MILTKKILILFPLLLLVFGTKAQENLAPLRFNRALENQQAKSINPAQKVAALGLPFFEDFTTNSLYPDNSRWADSNVYLNNTMAISPISRGVATFDALNRYGRPYDTVNRFNLLFADSLTSRQFDLSTYTPQDSLYLSFFYQPQGNGFSPEVSDSFQLYFHKKQGGWGLLWSVPGSEVQPFKQVMIAVTDTSYFYSGFEFRFLNKASINTNDDVWNLDYIKLGANRNINDTAIRDIAFTSPPSNYLKDYSSMPYRQYLPNATGETATKMTDSIWNHYSTNGTVGFGYNALEFTTGTSLGANSNTMTFSPFSINEISFPNFTTTVAPPSSTAKIVYKTTYFLNSGNPTEPKDNDSIIHEQVFDNYLAYDDGTAEKSYFLNLSPSLPGKIAIEYRLNAPDTLRGIAIYFGQQVPSAYGKIFSVGVYTALAGVSGANADQQIFQQDELYPLYTDEINHFTYYKFDSPVQLPKGVFYMGTIQPANSGSDSLYIGADMNRIGGNHLYYNVATTWQGSLFNAALMIRPLLGGAITPTAVAEQRLRIISWTFSPNPVADLLEVKSKFPVEEYMITDMTGRKIAGGKCANNRISTRSFSAGFYLLKIRQNGYWSEYQKFIKQ